ncbi:glycosyltransferase [Burkholderia sp. A1]|uniref:glycosyltransferase n=1 Tax=Burkholderia sp. A1 TaxID=148446 RepID=UPI00046A4C4C|nr:glycosyltransferase [Burkholderia sp. A1]
MKVFLMHPGRADYPELDAYTAWLVEHGYEVGRGDADDYRAFAAQAPCVLWCVMGFYRHLPPAAYVIHDYRSLSVGRLGQLKDLLKRTCQPRPQLRIFQNATMRAEMAFSDRVPSLLLPMGVPDWIFDAARRVPGPGPGGTYCYIGAINRERGFDRVLAAFRDRPHASGERFVLVGEPQPAIRSRFQGVAGVEFLGRLPQREALDVVLRSQFAVCYFPRHRPHRFQTPTKLLEYAALGKPILCNDAPSTLAAAAELGIPIQLAGRAIFDASAAWLDAPAYSMPPVGLERLAWRSVLASSGVLEHLRAASAAVRGES